MSRSSLPYYAGDISALARALKARLAGCDHTPGHIELLNMLAQSVGCRNYQHFRAQVTARDALTTATPPAAPVDYVVVKQLARYFDPAGRLAGWPSKFSYHEPCLWVLWSKLPPRQTLTEDQINRLLQDNHLFRDPAMLRREMANRGMVKRTADCREYRRVERQPPAEALALIRHLTASGASQTGVQR